MYSIRLEPALDLVDITWTGQFAPDVVAAYAAELRQAFDAAGFRPGYLLRIDMSLSAVQTQAAVASFARAFAGLPVARRIAIVTPSALARMQVERVMTQPYLRVFRTADDAWRWMFDRDDGGANPVPPPRIPAG